MIIGITFGVFDFVHTGHCMLLEKARKQCDYLIVGLCIDPTVSRPFKNKPVQSALERFVELRSNRFVDEIIPYETEQDVFDILEWRKPHKRFLGADYIGKDFSGKGASGLEIVYLDRGHDYSSTRLRERVFEAEKAKPLPIKSSSK